MICWPRSSLARPGRDLRSPTGQAHGGQESLDGGICGPAEAKTQEHVTPAGRGKHSSAPPLVEDVVSYRYLFPCFRWDV